MYQALYRKWRPLSFDDVVGQEHITETLKNQVKTDRLSHAYLFVGTRGTGKTTCAKILSRAVNCENPIDGSPCNKCPACLGIISGNIMDVEELDAASNNGVDSVRALRDEAVFSPTAVKKRVYIVDEVHMLSTSAFNALLKILEEPPEHLMFILATTELHKVPVTVLSRCQRYSFRRISSDSVAKRMKYIADNEQISLNNEAAEMLARLSEGSMRDALSLLDQCIGSGEITGDTVRMAMGLAGNSRITELFQLIAEGKTEQALGAFTSLWQDGKEPITLLDELSVLCRDILMCKVAPATALEMLAGGYDISVLKKLAKAMTQEQLLNKLKILQSSYADMKNSQNPRVTAEMCMVFLSAPELNSSTLALQERISRLELMFQNGAVLSQNVTKTAKNVQEVEEKTPVFEPISEEIPVFEPYEEEYVTEYEPEYPPIEDITEPAELAPEPVFEPVFEPAPQPIPVASGDSDEIWKKVLKELKTVLAVGTYNILCDNFHAEAVIGGNVVTIYIKNKFSMNMVDSPQNLDTIKFVLNKIMGTQPILKIEQGTPPNKASAGGGSKLDDLMKFGNVKFD